MGWCLDRGRGLWTVCYMRRVLVCLIAVAGLSSCSQRSEVVVTETAPTTTGTEVTTVVTNDPATGSTIATSTTVVDKAREQELSLMAVRVALALDYSLRSQASTGLTDLELYATDMRNGFSADMILKSKQEFGKIKIAAVGPKGERYVLWDNAATDMKVGDETVVWAYEVTTGSMSACAWIGENATMPAIVQTGAC